MCDKKEQKKESPYGIINLQPNQKGAPYENDYNRRNEISQESSRICNKT